MSTEIVESVDVAASPEVVFAAATDWAGQQNWMVATRVRATRGTGHAVGDAVEAVTGVGPIGVPDPMTVTEWDPPRMCRVRHDGRVVRGRAAFAVTPRPDGTATFTWSETLDLPFGPLGAAGFALGRPAFLSFLRLSLRRFARWAPGYQ